jgi:Immunity protein 35
MLDLESAKLIVLTYLNSRNTVQGDTLAIREDFIVEKEYGWIFSYDSSKFIETGEFRYRRVANFPILIFKDNGEMFPVNIYSDLESIITEHNKRLKFN